MKKIELLAPAGDLEKLKTAVDYGADAVYFGGEMFSLRAGAGNLSFDEMKEGLDYAHKRGVRCYLTVNIFAHNDDIALLKEYLASIRDMGIDAYLVSNANRLYKRKVFDGNCCTTTIGARGGSRSGSKVHLRDNPSAKYITFRISISRHSNHTNRGDTLRQILCGFFGRRRLRGGILYCLRRGR
jgi:hypothetical protein